MSTSTNIRSLTDLEEIKRHYHKQSQKTPYHLLVCGGAGCISSNCMAVRDALEQALEKRGIADQCSLLVTGCMGTCAMGPLVMVEDKSGRTTLYTHMTPEKIENVVKEHLVDGFIYEDYTFFDHASDQHLPDPKDIPFFRDQVKIALRNCGAIDYASIEAYIAQDGYAAIAKCLQGTQQAVVDEVKASGLRGRGGGGFPTGQKWQAGLNAVGSQKYIVCNADEGDPGAFMDRSILEGDPHGIIEGMMIGGFAIGASMGYVYVRAEYPIAVERLGNAIEQARARGLLGKGILGSSFDFDVEIRIGAGAFVCGEETSLMASIEGQRGEPRQKPPFPFERGLFGCPTIIDNVETFANIPAIMLKGSAWFTQYGTEKSRGTKVFALAGDIVNTGIVEVPMGTPLGDILFTIGGGIPGGKGFKAAQTGGPSGGCITKEHLNTPMDYESLAALGAIMGSGGLIVMSEETCMVDTARFFLEFIQDESCGKCVPCRIGTKRMLQTLERITHGQGQPGDIDLLAEMSLTIRDTAMCGLGQTAPNPVLSILQYFRQEYEEHIHDHHCSAGVCADLFLSPCENACPASVNVPGYMALIATGRFMDAYNLVRQENPFPAVCGRICTHPCETRCRRTQLDEAIAISDLKRFVADYAFQHETPSSTDIVFLKNGKSVGIIGAGPSGLTCAYYLARLGYDVDVYERQQVAGGVLRYGIPEYRLPANVLEHEIRLIEQVGVRIHYGRTIGRTEAFQDLREQHEALYIAIGTQLSNKAGVPGEDLPGVRHGLDFLRDVNLGTDSSIGKKVCVIGGGNTAIDAARVARRLGAEEVTILYRRTIDDMPANRSEIDEALEEGIKLITLAAPVEIQGKGKVERILCNEMELSAFDSGGRRKPKLKEGATFILEVDTVIPAVSQSADLPFVDRSKIELTKWDTFITQKGSHMTSMPGVFAGGDVARGSDVVITAIADGKQAAISIDKYLGGTGVLNKGNPISIPDAIDDGDVSEHKRFPMEILPPDARIDNFDEVVVGFHRLNAIAESMRCLRCDRR